MHSSLFHDVCLRELYGNKWTNQKRIPEIGIEFFECRSSQSFRLHSMLDGSAPPFACDFSPSKLHFVLTS
ncbi:unnamed protein product [Dicrocoelium dendriticum]|nr:unnamed protein product [Dicrocoelium dendriticum]